MNCPTCRYSRPDCSCKIFLDRRLCPRYRKVKKIDTIVDPAARERIARVLLQQAVRTFELATRTKCMRYCSGARWENFLASINKKDKK